ncbi:MAG: gliding motility protein GldM [Flavobacteriales bacterium]
MAKAKITPRQKMINLMYLVFIAMLAMNVDREVLRSFGNTNATLEDVVGQTTKANESFYNGLEKKAQDDPERYDAVYKNSQTVKEKADEFIAYIDNIKAEIGANEIDMASEDLDYKILESSEKLDRLFFKGGGEPNDKAKDFEKTVNEFRAFLLSVPTLKEDDKARIEKFFSTTPINKNKTWLNEMFFEQPNVASLTNLSLLETNVRNEESKIVSSMLATKLIEDVELNTFQPIVIAPSTIKQGDPANAKILLGAYDSSIQSNVVVNGTSRPMKNGVAEFELNTSSVGYETISGEISYINGAGKTISYPFNQQYYVAGEIIEQKIPDIAYGAVTADKMNVVYRGLDNPMSATMSGAKDGTIKLTASTGSLSSRGGGKYMYKPGSGETVTFTISGTTPKGKTVTEKVTYRIKNVPKPQGMVRGESALALPASSIGKVTVEAGFPNFLFDIKTNVTSFKVKVPGKLTMNCSGNRMSEEAKASFAKLRRGETVQIFDIKATSTVPIKDATPIVITVK